MTCSKMYRQISLLFNSILFCLLIVGQDVLCTDQESMITTDQSWSLQKLHDLPQFTQVPGVAVNKSILSIFHRSNVVWNQFSFDQNEVYQHQNEPITVDPVLNFNLSGHFVSSFGRNVFFMPHGLSYDPFGNVWLTDVALHQVFRYDRQQLERPAVVLGERFVPGRDAAHFCKPTDVQVSAKTKLVYVSDGYCNGRVVVLSYDGKFVKQFGQDQKMQVAHSLSLIEELDLVCVADRERGRALCYDAGIRNRNKLGEFRKELRPFQAPSANSQLYAIQNLGTYLFGALVDLLPPFTGENTAVTGLLFDLTEENGKELIWQGFLPAFKMPHDIAADEDHNLYLGDIGPRLSKASLVRRLRTNLPASEALVVRLKEHNEEDRRPKSKRIEQVAIAPKLKRTDQPKEDDKLAEKPDTDAAADDKPKPKRTDDNENDLKNLATTTTEASTAKEPVSAEQSTVKSKKGSLLLFILFVSSLLLISIVLFALKKRVPIENYVRSLGLPTKVFYSKDLYINDPERAGFNRLREEEENLFDFELENNSSESEVEEFNFKHVRKA